MSILDKFLQKKNIEDPSTLSPEEKVDYDRWQKILSEGEMTVEKISTFCQSQLHLIERQWRDVKVDEKKKAELIPYHTVYSVIKEAINAPRAEKESLERYLQQVIDNT